MHLMKQHARTQHARTQHTPHISHHTYHITYQAWSRTMYHVSYSVRCHEFLVILRDDVTNTVHLFYHKIRITTKRGWSACQMHWQLQLDKQSMQEQLICRVKNPPGRSPISGTCMRGKRNGGLKVLENPSLKELIPRLSHLRGGEVSHLPFTVPN